MTTKKKSPNGKSYSKKRSATAVDADMGQKVRLRRTELRLSQQDLADHLGVSFQQVQKYEKGVNRVGAARLNQIASILQVPITFFYDTNTKIEGEVQSLLFVDSHFSIKLLRAYSRIKDQRVQRQIVSLMESLAGEAEEAR